MGARSRDTVYIDWKPGPVGRKMAAAVFAFMLTSIHYRYAGFPTWAPGLIGAIVAVVVWKSTPSTDLPHLSSGLARQERLKMRLKGTFRAVCWLAAGVWTTATMWTGYNWFGGVALVVGTLAAVEVGSKIEPEASDQTYVPANGVAAAEEVNLLAGLAPDVKDGGPLFARQLTWALTAKGVAGTKVVPSVERVKVWPNGTGHSWNISAPFGTQFDYAKLRMVVDDLGGMLQWPVGCPILTRRSDQHQGAAILDMCVRNGMAETSLFPPDYRPRSIVDPIGLGQRIDSTPSKLQLFDGGLTSGLIIGAKGSGKTMVLHDLTGAIVCSYDAVVIHIDLNKGSLGAPWTRPFANGLVQWPAVDFVASTPDDALWVAEWAEAVATDRKARLNEIVYAHDADVLVPGNGHSECGECRMVHPPAIIIMVDEGAELAGEDAIGTAALATAKLRAVQRMGRAMLVTVLFSGLRGTGDVIPSSVKKLANWSIVARVRDDDELAYALDWNAGVSISNITSKGQVYVRPSMGGDIEMWKTYLLRPKQIGELVLATTNQRPQVPVEEAVHGWDRRWSRPDAASYLEILRSGDPVGDEEVEPGQVQSSTAVRDRPQIQVTGPAQEPPWSTGGFDEPPSVDERVLRMSAAELEEWWAMDTIAEPAPAAGGTPAAEPTAGEGSPKGEDGAAARWAYIADLLFDADEDGLKTQEIKAKVLNRYPDITRDRTVNEDLAAMRKGKMIAKHPDKYATWVLRCFNEADPGE